MALRRRAGAAAAVVLGVAVAACGTNDYRYVSNSSEGAFFKVPRSWELFRVRQEAPTDRPAPATSGEGPWHVVFDSAPDADEAHMDESAPEHPVGQALIIPLTASQGDGLSTKQLRGVLFGTDPLDAADQGTGDVEIVDFEQITTGAGLRGSRVVFNYQVDGSWATADQTTLLDDKASRAYVFEVRCESTCFDEHREEISRIVQSWQVRK
jgi:hypothetical protein